MNLPKKLGSLIVAASLVFGMAVSTAPHAVAQSSNDGPVILSFEEANTPLVDKGVRGKSAADKTRVLDLFSRGEMILRAIAPILDGVLQMTNTSTVVSAPETNYASALAAVGDTVTHKVTTRFVSLVPMNIDNVFDVLKSRKANFSSFSAIKNLTDAEWKEVLDAAKAKFTAVASFQKRVVAPQGFVCEGNDGVRKNVAPYPLAQGSHVVCEKVIDVNADHVTLGKVPAISNLQFETELAIVPKSAKYKDYAAILQLPLRAPYAPEPVDLPEVVFPLELVLPTVVETSVAPANPYPAGTDYTYSVKVTNKDTRAINISMPGFTCLPASLVALDDEATCTRALPVPAVPASENASNSIVTASLADDSQTKAVPVELGAKTFSAPAPAPAAPAAPAAPVQPAAPETPVAPAQAPERLSGANRILTAQAIFEAGAFTSKKAVLANGDSQVDAATSSPYASAIGAGMLLTGGKTLEPENLAFIKKHGITDVTLAGGTAAISTEVETALTDAGVTVSRISGSNRYLTSQAFANKTKEANKDVTNIFVTKGGTVLDALLVAPAATATKSAIILIDDTNGLPEAMQTFNSYVLVGDTTIASVAKGAKPSGSVTNIAGATTEEINLAIVRNYFADATAAYIANSETMADALSVGPVADKTNNPIFYVTKDAIAKPVQDYLAASKVTNYTILGGEAAVGKTVADTLAGLKKPATK